MVYTEITSWSHPLCPCAQSCCYEGTRLPPESGECISGLHFPWELHTPSAGLSLTPAPKANRRGWQRNDKPQILQSPFNSHELWLCYTPSWHSNEIWPLLKPFCEAPRAPCPKKPLLRKARACFMAKIAREVLSASSFLELCWYDCLWRQAIKYFSRLVQVKSLPCCKVSFSLICCTVWLC